MSFPVNFTIFLLGEAEQGTFFIPYVEGGRPSYASIIALYIAKISDDLNITKWDPLEPFFKQIDSHGKNFQRAEMSRDLYSQFAKIFALAVGYP